MECTKCWRTPVIEEDKECKTERRPPAHVGGEFNSCGVQVTVTGLAGDNNETKASVKKTFSNVEVQTMSPPKEDGKRLEEKACAAMTPLEPKQPEVSFQDI